MCIMYSLIGSLLMSTIITMIAGEKRTLQNEEHVIRKSLEIQNGKSRNFLKDIQRSPLFCALGLGKFVCAVATLHCSAWP